MTMSESTPPSRGGCRASRERGRALDLVVGFGHGWWWWRQCGHIKGCSQGLSNMRGLEGWVKKSISWIFESKFLLSYVVLTT